MNSNEPIRVTENRSSARGLQVSEYIVIAEDDEDDRELIRDAFLDAGLSLNMFRFVHDGDELMASLSQARQLPRLILLDLNMPCKNGKETLKEIRETSAFSLIPVVIFTTSNSNQDIRQCYSLGANAFITKPARYQDLVSALTSTKNFWLECSKNPLQ